MASKIFMGGMPELMENILINLDNELNFLYSCALVSRHWCKISIPILWKDPFSFQRSALFISSYFSTLGEDEKFGLKEYGINIEISETLFYYARFLKVLNLSFLEYKVKEWIDLEFVNSEQCYDTSNFIINLLLKLFIESGATLDKLVVYLSNSFKFKPEIFCSLGQNEQFISRLQHLCLSQITSYNIESATILLRTMAKYTTKISILKLEGFISDYDPQIFHAIIYVIKSQEQLRFFRLIGNYYTKFHGIISALESQKNSLQEVILFSCDYNVEFEVLNNCKSLKKLRIKYCDSELSKLSKILDYKISTLEVVGCSIDAQPITLMLEKSGILLQRLSFASTNDEIQEDKLLLKALKSFCPNITYLNIMNIEFSTQLIELIGNLQKLQFLSLWCFVDDNITDEDLKIRVIQFSEKFPLTLQYFNLKNNWLGSYTSIFLNHCNVPLKKLIIYRLESEKISKALVEFCMRKRTLNYVGINYLNIDDNIRKEIEVYTTLVPYERIIVNC
ncbi:hypothetical protein F8M41_017210 [Gigaspora margarita]|uniref:F-box domain-containing protein n=1 Tax=Gigaspora margarita TaxID=4874 RepID=A0A8H4EUE2_GIGMA|nr:hypothetical protein F8M41_017210 [Gigaspora margarita]